MRLPLVAPVVLLALVGCQAAGTDHPPSAAAKTSTHASAPLTSTVVSDVGGGSPYTAALSHPRRDPYYPAKGTTGVDALHYGLDLTWDATSRRLTGVATIRFRATRDESDVSLDFAAPLHASAVTLDGAAVTSTHPAQKLDIATGKIAANSRHTLEVTYTGKPHPTSAPTKRSDLKGLGWTVQPDGEVWSIQEPYGAFTWFPVNDQPSDKAFYDVTVHTQSAWTGVSNGQLSRDIVTGDERTTQWHLASPAASYLVTIAIGPYREYHQAGPEGLPLTYWVRDVDKRVLPVLRRSPAMLSWLQAHLGRYPFSSAGVVVVPTPSGEETQTMVTIGASVLKSPDGPSDLVHELSHQWYGDEVTPNNWQDLWLNESFAMYIQLRWEASHGQGSMKYWRRQLNQFDQMLRRKYGPPGDYDRNNFAELDVYYCGARMIDRLHSMLGAKLFAKVLRDWPRDRRFGNADRSDWISYLDRTTHRNLRGFVTTWLTARTSPA